MNEESFEFLRKKIVSFIFYYVIIFLIVFPLIMYGAYKLYLKDNIENLLGHNFDKEQAICLADNIYYESAGESKKGQLAVATVTLNRVKHEDFANSICRVVYERKTTCEFSWVCQRKISNTRFQDIHWKHIHKMSEDIISGEKNTLPELRNALYYHADYVKPFWAKHKQRITKIGAHIFYE
jgi:spore germination cell wall hydrolase CwlJ-like protein